MASQLQPSASPLAPSQSPTVPNSVEGIMAGIPKQQEDLKEEKDKLDTTLADDQQKRGALKPPDLQPVPQPTVAQTDPSKIWGSSAMLLAGLGGLLTRRPLVTAMNAASKVFQAYKQNDQEAAKQAFDSWKASNENALKLAEFQQKTYEEALKGIDSDEKGALAKYTAAARAFQDETGAKMAEIHGVLGAQQHVTELKRLSIEAAKAQGDIEEKNEQHQALMGARNAQKELQQARASKDPAKIAAAKQKLDDAMSDIHTINAAYGKGGSGSGNFRSLPAAIANKYMQEHPDATAEDLANFSADYSARNKTVSAFDSGTQGNSIRSFNTAIFHLSTLNGLVDALKNGDVTAANKLAQTVAQQTGKPAPTNFDAAKAIVGDEIVKAIVGGGGALADRENAQNQINKAESPEQLRGVIQTYKELMGGQLRGLKKQYESSTGRDDFNKKLFPETLQQLGGDNDRGSVPPDSGKKNGDYSHLWK